MEPTRRVVAGLTGAAFFLVGVGATAVILNGGITGDGAGGTGGAGTTMPRPSSPIAGETRTVSVSLPQGSGTPGTPTPSLSFPPPASDSPFVSALPSQHTTGFVQVGANLVYYAVDGSIIPVQPVPGLGVQVKSGKANYYALYQNPYGLAVGAYAGEFKPLVSMGQADGSSAETGGIVLEGPVVAGLISDQLAAIQSDDDRWIVALPVDIRSTTNSVVQVTFDQFGLAGWSNAPRVLVRFTGSLPIAEAIPNNGGYHVLVEGLGPTAWQVIDPARLSLPSGAIDPAHSMNELLLYGEGTPSLHGTPIKRDISHDGKVPIGQPMLSAASDVSVSLVVNGSHADLGPDKILTVGGVPVFVASS